MLVATLVVVAALAVAGYFWHQFQLHRIAGSLLERADQLETEGRLLDAAGYLHRYLQLEPEQRDVHIRLAQVYDKGALDVESKSRVVELYYIAIGKAPDRLDLHERLAVLLLEVGRFGPARDKAQWLLQQQIDQSTGLRVTALAAFGEHRRSGNVTYDEAVADLERALPILPGEVPLVAAYAQILLGRRDKRDVEQRVHKVSGAIDQMVAAAPESARAFLARFHFRRLLRHSDAADNLRRALELAPTDPLVLLTAGEDAVQRKDTEQAKRFYRDLIAIAPQNPSGYQRLIRVHVSEGHREQALEVAQQGRSYVGLDHAELNCELADLLIAAERLDEANQVLERMEAALATSASMTPARQAMLVLRGAWYLKQQQAARAIPLLKRVALQADRSAGEMPLRALHLLAQAYGQRGQWDLAATTFERLIKLRPQSFEVLAGAAEAWCAAGRLEPALQLCQQARQLEPADPRLLRLDALLQLQQQSALPPAQRDWSAFEQAIMAAETADPEAWEPVLLKARRFFVEGRVAALATANEILAQAEKRFAGQPAFALAAAAVLQQFRQYEDADRLLALAGPEYALQRVLAQADGLLSVGDSAGASRLLRPICDSSHGRQRQCLVAALARVERQAGDGEREEQYLRELAAATPEDGDVLLALHENALARGQLSAAESWEQRLRELEGAEEGTLWRYCQARRLLAGQAEIEDSSFKQVLRLQQELEAERPWWPGSHVLRGLVAESQGRKADAISAYETAIEMGERRLSVFQSLVRLLQEEHRLADAAEYLSRLPRSLRADASSPSLTAPSSSLEAQLAQALEQARRAVDEQPDDAAARMTLAQLLSMSNQREMAESQWQEAMRLAPDDLRTWSGLFLHYVRDNQRKKAIETLRQLSLSDHFPAAGRDAAVAQGYQLLGDDKSADEHYRQAQRAAETQADPASQRLQAALAMRSGDAEGWRQAQQTLEQLIAESDEVRAEDRLLLAQVYESLQNPDAARQQFLVLLDEPGESPPIAASYVGFLLRQRDLDAAAQWLDSLEKMEPQAVTTMALKARYLHAAGRADEIKPLVEPALERELTRLDGPAQARLMQQVANLYQAIEQPREVERWLRRLAATQPSHYEPLAHWLAQQGRVTEAVALCIEAWQREQSTSTALALARLLVRYDAAAEPSKNADTVFEEALVVHSDDWALLHAVGDLRLSQQRADEALPLYERVVELRPGQHLAWNNMATILAEQPGRLDQAMLCLERAVEAAGGELPLLADTKATILLYQGKPSEAADILERATSGSGADDPRLFFHLAVAYAKTGLSDKARQALDDAYVRDIESAFLSDRERRELESLEEELSLLP